ncbi:MAG: HypC/HybG/HupF family hydrogenase formation chaperone [Deltaproteobacteria bacterium]|nr:HypC/HybG/HupF family hydrogenase formation chaperone [Deltaproteobacteria bacterium]
MCLGVPGRVVEIDGLTASVDFWGVKRKVRLETVDEPVQAGDYVLVHVGFAIRRIPQEQIKETLDLYNQLIAATNQDLMAVDIQAEVAATVGTDFFLPSDEQKVRHAREGGHPGRWRSGKGAKPGFPLTRERRKGKSTSSRC